MPCRLILASGSPYRLALLREAGLSYLIMGIQSGSQRVLNEVLNRRHTKERTLQTARNILAALTRVGPSTKTVHRDRESLVCLLADRAVTHRAGAEPLHDGRDRLDLIDIDRRGSGLQLQQGTQRHEPRRPVVDPRGVALEHVIASGPGGVLQAEDAFRIEQMLFALATPLVLATGDQGAVRQRIGRRVGVAVMLGDIVSQFVQADALDPRTRAGEELRHELTVEADGLEDLRAAVGRHRGHAHLAHHLEQAVLERTDHVVNGLFRWHRHQQLAASQIFGALEKQVRVDRRRAVADQQGKMMHLPHITGLDDQARLKVETRNGEIRAYAFKEIGYVI